MALANAVLFTSLQNEDFSEGVAQLLGRRAARSAGRLTALACLPAGRWPQYATVNRWREWVGFSASSSIATA